MKRLLGSLFVLGLLSFVSQVPPQVNVMAAAQGTETLTLDVACDGRTFRLNRANPASTDPFGEGGDTFKVNGPIYPGGTIPVGGTFDNPSPFGPDSPGSIGTWTCRGTINFSQAEVEAGARPDHTATFFFLLDDGKGLITEGSAGERPIIGGMGDFSGILGATRAEILGFNSTGFPNFRTTFTLKR